MPLPPALPNNLIDGAVGHTQGHNAERTLVNALREVIGVDAPELLEPGQTLIQASENTRDRVISIENALPFKADLVGGVVPTSQMPSLAIVSRVLVANAAARLALTTTDVQPGDIAVQTDTATSWLLIDTDPSIAANWKEIDAQDAVTSVNSQTGAVTLGYTDVGAASSTHGHADLAIATHNHDATYVNEADHTKAQHDALGITPGDLTVTDAKVAAANKDGLAAVPSLRTLGTGAQQAAAGSHGHADLSPTTHNHDATYVNEADHTKAVHDAMGITPGDLTVTDAKVAAANKDGLAATPSMRTLGTGAQQAAAGSHGHADLSLATHNHDAAYVNEADHTKAAHDTLGIVPGDATVTAAKLSVTGIADGTKFLRDDMSWQTVAAGSHDHDTVYVNEVDHTTAAHNALNITPGDLTVTDAKVAAANKDGLATVASMRTLGTGAQQAAAGNHGHADLATSTHNHNGTYALLTGATFTGNITAPAFASSGLTGALATTRYVGGTTTGAPTTGTFAVGDWIVTQDGSMWVCTVAGTPGTWSQISGAGGGGATLSSALPLALGTAAAGTGTEASRADHVHPTTGLALSTHNHDGAYATLVTGIVPRVQLGTGTADATTILHGDGTWKAVSTGVHSHTEYVKGNGLQTMFVGDNTPDPALGAPGDVWVANTPITPSGSMPFAHVHDSLQAADGTAVAPTYSFASDPDTGLYRAADGVHYTKDGVDKGFLVSSGLRDTDMAVLRSNSNLSGGGIITVLQDRIKWSARFITIAVGRGAHFGAAGYYNIYSPSAGTVIPGYGGAANATVDANGYIPLGVWHALWAVPTIGGPAEPVSLAITNYTPTDFVVPPHWIFIAVRNGDDGRFRFGNGQTYDYWRDVVFSNAWTNYDAAGGGWDTCQYRKDSNGFVHLKGLVAGGTLATIAFTLPAGYRPLEGIHAATWSNSAPAGIRVYGSTQTNPGGVYLGGDTNYPGSNAWYSISIPPFFAEG